MGNESAVVRIKDVEQISGNIYKIAVSPAVSQTGDLTELAAAGATEVKFKIKNRMASTGNWKYDFAAEPFCVYKSPDTTCLATDNGQPKYGFSIKPDDPQSPNSFILTIPDLGTGSVEYSYRLFVNRKLGTQAETIIIDPKIKNGGLYSKSLVWIDQGGFGTEILLFLGFIMFVAGLLIGRDWVRRDQSL
jgi:hypothetical protein